MPPTQGRGATGETHSSSSRSRRRRSSRRSSKSSCSSIRSSKSSCSMRSIIIKAAKAQAAADADAEAEAAPAAARDSVPVQVTLLVSAPQLHCSQHDTPETGAQQARMAVWLQHTRQAFVCLPCCLCLGCVWPAVVRERTVLLFVDTGLPAKCPGQTLCWPCPLTPLTVLCCAVQIFDLETRYLEGCNPNANALTGACVCGPGSCCA